VIGYNEKGKVHSNKRAKMAKSSNKEQINSGDRREGTGRKARLLSYAQGKKAHCMRSERN